MKTVFLLDVDGPINSKNSGWSCAPLKGYAWAKDTKKYYDMQWSHHLISRLRKIERVYPETICWATSWCGSTDNLERLFKLPPLLSASSTRMSGVDKLNAAQAVLDNNDRLIWADDEFTPDDGGWYDEYTSSGQALLFTPKTTGKRQGLRPADLDRIDKFMLGS